MSKKKAASKPYHYTQCGLKNVFLVNGFHLHNTPYGDGVSFEDVEGLHKAIGRALTYCDRDLKGEEFRYLRKEMEMTQADVARLFDCDAQTIARWEKDTTPLPTTADRLIRIMYGQFLKDDPIVIELLEKLAELDALEQKAFQFKETKDGWKLSAAS